MGLKIFNFTENRTFYYFVVTHVFNPLDSMSSEVVSSKMNLIIAYLNPWFHIVFTTPHVLSSIFCLLFKAETKSAQNVKLHS